MTMQEPKVEVVEVDLKEATVTASTGGGQRCVGAQPDAEGCAADAVDTHWL